VIDIFNQLYSICIENSEITFNIIISTVFFLALVETVYVHGHSPEATQYAGKRKGHPVKSLCFFGAMYVGHAFYYSVAAIIVVSIASTINLFTA
jgi:hypothetical protein